MVKASFSRRELSKYAAAAALLSLAPLGATLDARKASADNPRLIDFAERRIAPAEIKSAGYAGVVNYVSDARPGADFEAKPLTREYADSLRAAGLHIVSNFQYGKPGGTAPSDLTRGFDGGVADAHTALRIHNAAGGSNSAPIFFSVDDDINVDTWNSLAVNWFRGINSVLGTARTGIYGHFQACQWATNDGVIGHSTTAGHQWAWQTKSWSHGQRESTAVLYQEVVNTPSNPGPLLGGIHIDVDEVLAPDFGQWDLGR
jgi:glycoside hydrolase-like protein